MTPAVLDAACFPHIIDLIFEYASPTLLLHLRLNREWKRRAEALVAHRITVTQTQVQSDWPRGVTYKLESTGRGTLGSITSSQMVQVPLTCTPTFLHSTAVVDLHVPAFRYETERILRLCPRGMALRFLVNGDFWAAIALKPRCIVLFAQDTAMHKSVRITDYRLSSLVVCDKLVLHLWRPGVSSRTHAERGCMKGVRSLVLIMHPWVQQPLETLPPPFPIFMQGVMGPVVDLLLLGWLDGVPITVVGYEFPSWHSRFHDLARQTRKWFVQGEWPRYVRELSVYGQTPLSTSEEDNPPLRFLSLDEYRAEVGQTQFEIEMNPGPIACPRSRAL